MFSIFENPLVRQYIVVITVNLSVLCTGLGLAWSSPVLVKLRDPEETIFEEPVTEEEGAWIVSIGYLFGIFAIILPALLLDRIGRRLGLQIASASKLPVGLLYTLATEQWMLLVARVISGIADVYILTAVSVYASEIASTKIRGSLGTILQIMSTLGILIMLSMGPFTSYVTLNAIYTAVVVVTFVPLLFLPESPYFLYSKGRTEEATKVLIFLRGSEELVDEELKAYAINKSAKKLNMLHILKNRQFLKGFGIVAVLGIGSQLAGFNAVSFYLQTVLESTQTSVAPEVASVIIGAIQLFASICTTIVTDRFGRKPILGTTLIGMCIGMLGLGTFFKLAEGVEQITGFMNYLPIISLILVVYCYSAGIGSVNWALYAELFDSLARPVGLALAAPISMIFIFLTARYFASITYAIGPAATYWIFSANCFLLMLFIMICIPETKGKTFAEIQHALGAKQIQDEEKVEDDKK